MASHVSDWHPGRVSQEYRDNYEQIQGFPKWDTSNDAVDNQEECTPCGQD